jgi:metallophosphoesterase superfamily enzyme
MRAAFDALGPLLTRGPEPADDRDEDGARVRYRAVFVSDLHLGTPGCQADALLDFLKHHGQRVPLPGRRHHRRLAAAQALVLAAGPQRRGAEAAAQGAQGHRVIFVPGNHDEFARKYLGHNFGGVDVVQE